MNNKIPKAAYQIIPAFFFLAFTIIACNNKKSAAPKEPPPETDSVKTVIPSTPVEDTVKPKPVKGPVDPVKDPPQ